MNKVNSHEHYFSKVLHVNALLERDISQDQKLLNKLQADLDKLVEHYSETDTPGKELYLMYQAQALLNFRKGDTASAIDYMNQAVAANGKNYDFADEFLKHVDASYKQPENKNRTNRGTYFLSCVVLSVTYVVLLFGIGLAVAVISGMRTEAGVHSIYNVTIKLSWTPYMIYLAALALRRLHDLGQSGWWSSLIFVPILNIVFILYLMIAAGNPTSNAYGMPPRKTYLAGLFYK